MMEIEDHFAEFRPLVDALITERLMEFYNALIERGQISRPRRRWVLLPIARRTQRRT